MVQIVGGIFLTPGRAPPKLLSSISARQFRHERSGAVKRARVHWAAIGILAASSFLRAASDPKPPQTLVITNVNIVDTRRGDVRPHMTVAIKDGLITAVMKFAIIEAGPGVQVVNGNGGFLLPGLWDMKTHLERAPADTRKVLVRSLAMLASKREDLPHRKHGNVPL